MMYLLKSLEKVPILKSFTYHAVQSTNQTCLAVEEAKVPLDDEAHKHYISITNNQDFASVLLFGILIRPQLQTFCVSFKRESIATNLLKCFQIIYSNYCINVQSNIFRGDEFILFALFIFFFKNAAANYSDKLRMLQNPIFVFADCNCHILLSDAF